MLRLILVAGLILVLLSRWDSPTAGLADPAEPKLRTKLRRPVALLVKGHQLIVGNRASGSLTVIDRTNGRVLREHEVAETIADIARIPETPHLLVLDEGRSELLRVTLEDGKASVRTIAKTPYPGSKLAFDSRSRTVFISSKWSHRILAFRLDETLDGMTESLEVKLAFAPLELHLLPESQKLLAAEAFGNRLAVLDAADPKLLAVREVEGHNIRGLAESEDGQRLLIAHQQIPNQALADYEEVHWGRMVTNAVQTVDLQELLVGETGGTLKGWLDEHGGIGSAQGDPGGVISGPDGFVAVAFSGVGEVTIGRKGYKKRIPVKARPEALALADDHLYVANRFDDSVSVIDVAKGEVVRTISLGPMPRLTSEQRGELLFFDARLSHDGWMSCHSCHTDGHTAGIVVDTLGDGDYGAPKLTPSLLGTRDTRPWGWDGGTALFRQQIQKSVTTTMHGEPLDVRELEDLSAYLGSLNSPPPVDPPDADLVKQGRAVFEANSCANCHAPPAYTTPVTADVGLLDELKRSIFNPPSLRGVSQRRRFFHDGRAESLEDVLLKTEHQLDGSLKESDAEALLAFLRSL